MAVRPLAACLLILLGLAQAARLPPTGPSQPSYPRPRGQPKHASDRILVKSRAAAKSRSGAGVQTVKLSAGTTVEAALAAYRARKDVLWAEPDYAIYPDNTTPNDPLFANEQWALQHIGAPTGWDTTTGSADVTVCVVDTGIEASHPDLAPNLAPGVGWNAIYGSTSMADVLGHGTAVAGIVGAVGNNAMGVAGVNWQVNLLICRFFDDQGHGWVSSGARCVRWCADSGAKIIQASWSGDGYSQEMYDAISYAGSKDVLFVGSAANKASDLDAAPSYPPSYKLPNQIAVAALDYSENLAAYSNYGATTVHLAAPGDWIQTTLRFKDGTYGYKAGTSMSTPIVSGAAALLAAATGGQLGALELKAALLAATVPLTVLQGKTVTGGRLDLGLLLEPYRFRHASDVVRPALSPNAVVPGSSQPGPSTSPQSLPNSAPKKRRRRCRRRKKKRCPAKA